MKIGFIGLGRMGSGMVRNLLRAGHAVVVFNRSRDKAEALVADGVRIADSPGGACRESEAVMTMVADDHAVEQIVFGENAIGRQTFVVGSDPSQANAAKLCGNFMIAAMLEAFGEAFATLRKAGVPPHAFLEVMSTLFGSPVYANYGRLVADEKFEPAGFALRLGLKDVRLLLETADEFAAPMPLASLIRDHLLSAMAHGQADLDWSSVTRVAARSAGAE
jgi:3-hydroxyisobutyrate dehydrogenase-like beta-hydroxyacid dehydrogenase